ncbi:LSU ribosomal protein L16p (L10e) [Candidatus Nasuia deltocephalinicola]|uniref:50S ribosomal protein L16 n=1 Tax=Candidatus Nasuia deltocephalincola TaxID=1160784 RepID=A0A0S2UPM3_9PROT|nr:LSU ribosomal protein L16p (L10e) [Candidatus Nasuia deltocephalinicola]
MCRIKFIKNRRRKKKIISCNGNILNYGDYGLKSLSWGRLTKNQIEAGRKVITRHVRGSGKIWIRINPDTSFTKKPIDTRMGNGKGDILYYYFFVKPGKIIYEISGLSKINSLNVLRLASFKLPLKTIII